MKKKLSIKWLIYSDFYRYTNSLGRKELIKAFIKYPGARFTFFLRIASDLKVKKGIYKPLLFVAKLFHRHYKFKYGFDIPAGTDIGPGFYLGHFGSIIINPQCVIGRNCNISPGVVLGKANRGRSKGLPVLKDNIYIGPGAKIVGNITVGNNVAIGANAVVTMDVQDNAVVTGIPGKVISSNGSNGYINNTEYDLLINKKINEKK